VYESKTRLQLFAVCVISFLLLIPGCWRNPDRERAEKLQKAAFQADRKYKNAMRRLTSRSVTVRKTETDDSSGETPSESAAETEPEPGSAEVCTMAVELFDEIAAELEKAIAEDDRIRRQQQEDEKPAPVEDADRASVFKWWSNAAVGKANHYRSVLSDLIEEIDVEWCDKGKDDLDWICEKCHDIVKAKKKIGHAGEFKTQTEAISSEIKKLQKDKEGLEGEIDKISGEIKNLQQSIADNTEKSTRLKLESTNSEDRDGMKKLQEAQALDKKNLEHELKIRELTQKKEDRQQQLSRTQVELDRATEKLETLKKKMGATGKEETAALEDIKKMIRGSASGEGEEGNVGVSKAVENFNSRLQKAAELTVKCMELGKKTEEAYDVALAKADEAIKHVPQDEHGEYHSDKASVLHNHAILNIELLRLQDKLAHFDDEIKTRWKIFDEIRDVYTGDAPPKPENKHVWNFIEEMGKKAEKDASELYKKSMEAYMKCIEISPQRKKPLFMCKKALFLVDYAQALAGALNDRKAAENMLQEAGGAVSEAGASGGAVKPAELEKAKKALEKAKNSILSSSSIEAEDGESSDSGKTGEPGSTEGSPASE